MQHAPRNRSVAACIFVAWPNVLSPTSEELKQHIQTLRLADWQRYRRASIQNSVQISILIPLHSPAHYPRVQVLQLPKFVLR